MALPRAGESTDFGLLVVALATLVVLLIAVWKVFTNASWLAIFGGLFLVVLGSVPASAAIALFHPPFWLEMVVRVVGIMVTLWMLSVLIPSLSSSKKKSQPDPLDF